MKARIVYVLALVSAAFAVPVTRDTLGSAQASVDQLMQHLRSDRELAETAFRRLQTKVLDYRQSVEGYEAWRAYVEANDKALDKAEGVRRFLMKVDGIHGIRQEPAFSFQAML